MISIIQFEKCGIEFSFPISQINCVFLYKDKNIVMIGLVGEKELQENLFENEEKARNFYNYCITQIERYNAYMATGYIHD